MTPFDYQRCYHWLTTAGLTRWVTPLQQAISEALNPEKHGDLPQWITLLNHLPPLTTDWRNAAGTITIGQENVFTAQQIDALRQQLLQLHPWRKGPFNLFGMAIETEWRSDWKWARLLAGLQRGEAAMAGRRVLDVGCGNGYYGWQMLAAGAEAVLGIDPTLRYVMQYHALSHFMKPHNNFLLPLRLEQLPTAIGAFDSVLSLGVIYHQRDPIAHLQRLHGYLRSGGELLLEGLVLPESAHDDLPIGTGRYAKMHNIHLIPRVATVLGWLEAAGYTQIATLDITPTTTAEQRQTPWMQFESLPHFLNPQDSSQTIEGHPAPLRALWRAAKAP
ncbi:MAG: tRNA 5-methoxyuridine(34)/uridine 5-oxyacetic acid(34) synthase CmoB [Gammaproteobacteria bacterium]|nr:tRNA 5-methoxyuridine(34)/uridine 5-oxyacetic acid(34) synthase CmoB [Gammaproteobacteria bacterium]